MYSSAKKGGISIVGILLLGILLILVLSYFHISIRTVVESPDAQDNIQYVGGASRGLWDTYLKGPAEYLWNDVWLEIFWRPFIKNMIKLRDTGHSDLDNSAPRFSY